VVKNRGQYCGDIELAGCLANAVGPVPLVLDLHVAHDRFGSSSDPSLNGNLHYPNDIDRSINEAAANKIRKYHADYNNNPPTAVSFMPAIASTSGRLHSEFIRLLFLQAHRETDRFFAASGVRPAQHTSGLFHFRRAAFSSLLKSRVGTILAKAAALRITLNLDGAPITSKSHTHSSHSQSSRLLTSSLSLGVPVPRPTQCMRAKWHVRVSKQSCKQENHLILWGRWSTKTFFPRFFHFFPFKKLEKHDLTRPSV
jgi:hypothetical protein